MRFLIMKRFTKLLITISSIFVLSSCGAKDDKPIIIVDDSESESQNIESSSTTSEKESEDESTTSSESQSESESEQESESESEQESESQSEETGDVVFTWVETYNDEYMKFSYTRTPFSYEGHKCDEVRVNGEARWYEDLPDAKMFNVRVVNIKLTEYTFDFMENGTSYLTVKANVEQDGPGEDDPPYVPGEIIELGFVLVDAYNDIYVKVSYTVDPFDSKYGFSYYTVNDGEHKTWKVKDGSLYQLQLGSNDPGDYTIKFYNTDDVLYGQSTITIA